MEKIPEFQSQFLDCKTLSSENLVSHALSDLAPVSNSDLIAKEMGIMLSIFALVMAMVVTIAETRKKRRRRGY